MQLEEITVRALTDDEIKALTPEDVIYVPDPDFKHDPFKHDSDPNPLILILVEARRAERGEYYLKQGSLQVQNIYGVEYWVPATQVFTADPDGQAMPKFSTAGTNLSLALYIPGMSEEEAKTAVFDALRAKFGAGVVQVWNARTRPVKDLRYDVYEEKMVYQPGPSKKDPGTYVATRVRTVANGVLGGQVQYLRGQNAGTRLVTEIHIPAESVTETI
ncbi:hypothetical protein [Kitasatospora viridis]|uniref:Uncharacterized protein n=1 Tax=Kitasatospora viridis TaxID=281105 RepID=A0A561SA41_9ACTN|nr:hypothetical protein [Kitasatospora viridis]TWF71746.1 hypothetical protein FHX73_18117 [Kitasatospora viridis]